MLRKEWRSVKVFPASQDSYDLSGFHCPYDLVRHVFPNCMDNRIHSDHSYLEMLEKPLNSTLRTYFGSALNLILVKIIIFLSTGGWNSYQLRQAAPEDAQKSKNLLYLVSLSCTIHP